MATITIKNKVTELSDERALGIAKQMMEYTKPEEGEYNYGSLSLGGAFDSQYLEGFLDAPVRVRQEGKRKSAYSPINIIID